MASRVAIGLIVCVFAFVSTARADIIFGLGNSAANKNVGDFESQTSTSAAGRILGPDLDNDLLAQADQGITIPASELSLEATSTEFTTLTFTPLGSDWLAFEANLAGSEDGTFIVKALDDDGNEFTSATFDLNDTGQNRFFAQAINGQTITQVTVIASGAIIEDVGQVRISQSLVSIPEPSSVAFGAAGVVGLILLRRRKRAVS